MANPQVREHLVFLPEDSGKKLSEAWQAERWLKELDGDLTTPMIRSQKQDFYIWEPAMLRGRTVCMPVRWFRRGRKTMCRAWKMASVNNRWVVQPETEFEADVAELHFSLPYLIDNHQAYGIPDPRLIIGETIFIGVFQAPEFTCDLYYRNTEQRGRY